MNAESRAIMKYYAEKYANQGTELTGRSLEEKAVVDQWIEVESHNFNDVVQPIVFNVVVLPRMGGKCDAVLVKTLKQKLRNVLDVYEARLAETKYLAGDRFTLADLTNMPAFRYLVNQAGMDDLINDRKRLSAWWQDVSARPAWKKLVKIAGL